MSINIAAGESPVSADDDQESAHSALMFARENRASALGNITTLLATWDSETAADHQRYAAIHTDLAQSWYRQQAERLSRGLDEDTLS